MQIKSELKTQDELKTKIADLTNELEVLSEFEKKLEITAEQFKPYEVILKHILMKKYQIKNSLNISGYH